MPRHTSDNPVRALRDAPHRRAFTLLELLVAVGVSVLLALALAQLFKTTGDTVTQGRRTAYFNSYAGMIQRTLARDFAEMSRDGHLVIRHEVTNSASGVGYSGYAQVGVPLARGSSAALARPRRIDELMFFTEGRYTSAREAASPGFVATASQQRVYYGMGTVSPPIPAGANFHYATITDTGSPMRNPNLLAGRVGQPSVPSVVGPGPNAFASDWILLRHATLLASPRSSARDLPQVAPLWGQNPLTNQGRARLEDKDRQIAGLPAASSIFRALNRPPSGPPDFSAYPSQGGYRRPPQLLFSSGLVDIATTDLTEIRTYITQMHQDDASPPTPQYPWDPAPTGSIVGVVYPIPAIDAPLLPSAFNNNQPELDLLYNMHAWMRNSMPTNSHGDRFATPAANAEAPRVRIRSADAPSNLPDILSDPSLAAANKSFQRADMLSNERMLIASNFLPHCTEFIVEWSFGEMDPQTGQTVWYGSSIPEDTDGNGVVDRIGIKAYDYYDQNADPPEVPVYQDKRTGRFFAPAGASVDLALYHPVHPLLIHGQTYDDNFTPTPAQPRPLVAHFGYTDPTYVPRADRPEHLRTMPWAWPALIRVTLSLTDPTDPTVERTFQFVFQTPPAPRS